MRHLIVGVIVLGFAQSLQAKLDVDAFSSENNENNTEYLECVRKSKVEPVKNSPIEKPSPRSTDLISDQKNSRARKPAQENSNAQVLSGAHSCVAHFTGEGYPEIKCNGQLLSGTGRGDGLTDVISLANHYLAEAGFVPISCWGTRSNTYCAYHKPQQN